MFSLYPRLCVLANEQGLFQAHLLIRMSPGLWGPWAVHSLLWHGELALKRPALQDSGVVTAWLLWEQSRPWSDCSDSSEATRWYVKYKSRTTWEQRLGPIGSHGGDPTDKPTPGTKANEQSQRPFHSVTPLLFVLYCCPQTRMFPLCPNHPITCLNLISYFFHCPPSCGKGFHSPLRESKLHLTNFRWISLMCCDIPVIMWEGTRVIHSSWRACLISPHINRQGWAL